MSSGDKKMNRHDVTAALDDYEDQIDAGTADWHVYHQAGVAHSTLAEQARRLRGDFWRDAAATHLTAAVQYLAKAAELTKDIFGLARSAVQCDHALAIARKGWLQPSERVAREYRDDAKALLVRVATRLEDDYTAHQDLAIIHQKAIAHGLLARLAFGNCLGFADEDPVWHDVDYNIDLAEGLFRSEGRQDNKRAYRSFLLWTALGYDAANSPAKRRQFAGRAGWSALWHGDAGHLLRALAIYWRGTAGERWLLRRASQ